MKKLISDTNNNLEDSRRNIEKITPDSIKAAVSQFTPEKKDVSNGFSSDHLLHAPDILFSLLADIFKFWCFHGSVSNFLLTCEIFPLVKGLKDPSKIVVGSLQVVC